MIRDVRNAFDANPVVGMFMLNFSRFEFALKVCGFVRASRDDLAEPEWDRFASHIAQRFDVWWIAPPDLWRDDWILAKRLMDAPPRVQRYVDGRLQWQTKSLGDGPISKQICVAVRRVRNNLFHGGKDLLARLSRDRELVESSDAVLRVLLFLDSDIRDCFSYGKQCAATLVVD